MDDIVLCGKNKPFLFLSGHLVVCSRCVEFYTVRKHANAFGAGVTGNVKAAQKCQLKYCCGRHYIDVNRNHAL